MDWSQPKIWNEWRKNYYSMSDQDHFDFINQMAERYPDQNHASHAKFIKLFESIDTDFINVMEVGGWKGHLAQTCMSRFFNIIRWHNYDYCEAVKNQQVCARAGYEFRLMQKFDWFNKKREQNYTIFIAAHSLEHLSNRHFIQLIRHISGIPIIAIEMPIQDHDSNWTDYIGTHKLKMGWNKVTKLLNAHRYDLYIDGGEFKVYVKKGLASDFFNS